MSSTGPDTSHDHLYVLVTGTNRGIGYSICCRLLDDFLHNKPSVVHLTLIFTTRSARRGEDTLKHLGEHLSKHKPHNRLRVHLRPENVELTSLLSVRALSKRLIDSDVLKFDAIILNAGFGGFTGVNWPLCIWTLVTDPIQTTTYPGFKKSGIGYATERQLPNAEEPGDQVLEPPLGQVFCANTFGHYMLAHWLMPLLRSPSTLPTGRIIWMGSVEISASSFNLNDLQALTSPTAYDHTKRLIDLLALTADNQPATAQIVKEFYTTQEDVLESRSESLACPRTYVAHPGVCATSIIPLDSYFLNLVMIATFYLVRLIGSPWHTVSTYVAATAPSWLALASQDEIDAKQQRTGGGNAKWGSAVDRFGHQSVVRTDVDGWGTNGTGEKIEWWGGSWGRKRGATDATERDVGNFVEEGVEVWRGMEVFRKEWETRIIEYEQKSQKGGMHTI